MLITFLDGTRAHAHLYTHSASIMRVAVRGADDLVEFTSVSNQWVSENCEPVTIEFEWERIPRTEPVSEQDCICPADLAAQLMDSLSAEAEGDDATPFSRSAAGSNSPVV